MRPCVLFRHPGPVRWCSGPPGCFLCSCSPPPASSPGPACCCPAPSAWPGAGPVCSRSLSLCCSSGRPGRCSSGSPGRCSEPVCRFPVPSDLLRRLPAPSCHCVALPCSGPGSPCCCPGSPCSSSGPPGRWLAPVNAWPPSKCRFADAPRQSPVWRPLLGPGPLAPRGPAPSVRAGHGLGRRKWQ